MAPPLLSDEGVYGIVAGADGARSCTLSLELKCVMGSCRTRKQPLASVVTRKLKLEKHMPKSLKLIRRLNVMPLLGHSQWQCKQMHLGD